MDFHTNIWYHVKTKPRMEEVAEVNDRMDQTSLHQKGEEVFIKSGPFKDFKGIFEKYEADNAVIVLINFLRHQQRLKIKPDMII